jgi:large subunit ribosomal protein L31e
MSDEKHERIVNIPLRAGLQKEPRGDRTKRAIYEIRQYAFRHADVSDVKVSKMLNESIWARGKKKPPARLRVKILVSEGVAKVMLPDEKEEARKKAEPKGAVEALKERMMGGAKATEEEKKQAKTENPEAKPSVEKQK